MLRTLLDWGLFIGITGWVSDVARGKRLRLLLPHIPLDRLMIETDAPYLTPQSMPNARRYRRNEPAFLPYVAQDVAQLLGISFDDLATATTRNVQRLFGWAPEAASS